eukprot:CAMPEP_0184747360 /NCGR_PEP_ID=MMETSP0315-20130426/10498_1 /TAXON_ID=101924 /ORGANISM="Rhodosorus marinus, Strain UTEX LB 2760" /LENGTH=34 /DNA_ID= /DNA_START= /DNA_END= /DNA_ORIENTATION=
MPVTLLKNLAILGKNEEHKAMVMDTVKHLGNQRA